MLQAVIPCLVGLLATMALVILLSPLARRIGLVDTPRGHKQHRGEVPLVGGIAMFAGFSLGVLAIPMPVSPFLPLFAGAAVVLIVGLLDDFRELHPNTRFAAQIGAGLLMALWGQQTLLDLGPLVGDWTVQTGAWAIPFTLFAVAGVMNALNMQDGIDGLAGGQAALAFLILGTLAFGGGEPVHGTLLLTLASVTLGFLAYNIRVPGRARALVFMGDAGSLFLGFALAWFVVDLSQHPNRVLAPVTALWVLAIPLMDTVCIMLRRLARGRSPFLADREHLHHLLQTLGLGVGGSVALTLVLSGTLAGMGYLAQQNGVPDRTMFGTFLVLFAIYVVSIELAWRRFDAHGHVAPNGARQGPKT